MTTSLGGFAAITLTEIVPSPNNPREHLHDIEELASSIRENGLIQPLVVQKVDDRGNEQTYQVVAGHRRLAALQLLDWATAPCIIRKPMRPDQELLAMLVENGQRAGLDPIEEARALNRLKQRNGLTDQQIARKVGRSQTLVSGRLALLALAPDVQEEIRAGQRTLTEAVGLGRIEAGTVKPTAKGKRGPQHLYIHHELGAKAKARCVRLGHGRGKGAGVGGIACGACWESVIRADERTSLQNRMAATDHCPVCDQTRPQAASS